MFVSAFDQAGIGMALVGLDGRFLHFNRALCHLVGYSEEELLTRTFQDITHPEDLETDVEQTQRLIRGESDTYQMQKRYFHRQGRVVWILLTVSIVRDQEKQPRFFISQIQDITEWKRAEEVGDLIFELPIALHFIAGFDGYFKKLSASWSQVLGHSVKELLSRPYLEFVHPEDRNRTIEQANKVADGRESVLFENRYRHADGTYRWILWTSISLVENELIYGVALDYTTRKQMEIELHLALEKQRSLYDELESSTRKIQQLRSGLLTVCAWTKRIRHEGKWLSPDEFLRDHLQLPLTHGISDESFLDE